MIHFRAGGYVQLECPPHVVNYKDFDIQDEYRGDWDKFNLWRFVSKVDETTIRAYSMANYPDEKGGEVQHPRGFAPAGARRCPARQDVVLGVQPQEGRQGHGYGPFGEFFARDTDHEMVFVGGARAWRRCARIFDQLKRLAQQAQDQLLVRRALDARGLLRRGVRQARRREPQLQSGTSRSPTRCPRITGPATPASSTTCLYENYLKDHPAPKTAEFYMCGPR